MALSNYDDISTPKEPTGTFVSVYAGAGGMDLGFALAGFTPVWVNEMNKDAIATNEKALTKLIGNHDTVYVPGDILAVPESQLPTRGSADLVIGGPPCQGFSVAGKMDPTDIRSQHVFHFLDMVNRVQPKAFVLENVKSLYSNPRWEGTRVALIERANQLGYKTQLILLDASHYGVPQRRERMFLIGVQDGYELPGIPVPTTASSAPTVRDALAQLPGFGEAGNDTIAAAKITTTKNPVLRKSPYAGMLFNGAGRPLNLDAPSLTMAASMGGNRTPIIDQEELDGASDSWVEDYHSTLMAGEAPVSVVPKRLRRLTVEEAAAIQTFPLGMEWVGAQTRKYHQIGNAVPPRLAYAVAASLRNILGT